MSTNPNAIRQVKIYAREHDRLTELCAKGQSYADAFRVILDSFMQSGAKPKPRPRKRAKK